VSDTWSAAGNVLWHVVEQSSVPTTEPVPDTDTPSLNVCGASLKTAAIVRSSAKTNEHSALVCPSSHVTPFQWSNTDPFPAVATRRSRRRSGSDALQRSGHAILSPPATDPEPEPARPTVSVAVSWWWPRVSSHVAAPPP